MIPKTLSGNVSAHKKWYIVLKEKLEKLDLGNQPLWGNLYIKIPFNETLYHKNIRYIQDLCNNEGTPYSKIALGGTIGKTIMFSVYAGIWKAIPRIWKECLQNLTKSYNKTRPVNIEWITKVKKGTGNIRKVLHMGVMKEIPKDQQKWPLDLDITTELDWKYNNSLASKCKVNARCKYFQFQVLHRTLITDKKLLQFGIKEYDRCEFCGQVETIVHIFHAIESITYGHSWNNG